MSVPGLFKPLPMHRKELERNARREHAKASSTRTRTTEEDCPSPHGRSSSTRGSVTAMWGPMAREHAVDIDLAFMVQVDRAVLRPVGRTQDDGSKTVKGLISKFTVGCRHNGTDRQFVFVNGRPCAPTKPSGLAILVDGIRTTVLIAILYLPVSSGRMKRIDSISEVLTPEYKMTASPLTRDLLAHVKLPRSVDAVHAFGKTP
ncbi:hypothetical protein LXA43DRAFT_1064376 [Ganoderma leucocontextum]|nr:hypothetical protein LXA43DRAFT_1064376 [Ganoderma leucocontextum]